MQSLPLLYEIREDLAQRFRQVPRSESLLAITLGTRPRSGAGEEVFLSITSLSPCDSFLEVVGSRLLDRKPTVRERFRVVSDETQPVLLLTRRDSVWLREDTYEGFSRYPWKEKRQKGTYQSSASPRGRAVSQCGVRLDFRNPL